jgi:hypothetical protein
MGRSANVAVFVRDDEIIIMGLGEDDPPPNKLFGPKSGRNSEEYHRTNIDIDNGETVHIEPSVQVALKPTVVIHG